MGDISIKGRSKILFDPLLERPRPPKKFRDIPGVRRGKAKKVFDLLLERPEKPKPQSRLIKQIKKK
tara:strand:- start:60 stop:257 length:198 start_codon:yes stop_codon:yes gene_type:complete